MSEANMPRAGLRRRFARRCLELTDSGFDHIIAALKQVEAERCMAFHLRACV
jgi:hypothetical protein